MEPKTDTELSSEEDTKVATSLDSPSSSLQHKNSNDTASTKVRHWWQTGPPPTSSEAARGLLESTAIHKVAWKLRFTIPKDARDHIAEMEDLIEQSMNDWDIEYTHLEDMKEYQWSPVADPTQYDSLVEWRNAVRTEHDFGMFWVDLDVITLRFCDKDGKSLCRKSIYSSYAVWSHQAVEDLLLMPGLVEVHVDCTLKMHRHVELETVVEVEAVQLTD